MVAPEWVAGRVLREAIAEFEEERTDEEKKLAAVHGAPQLYNETLAGASYERGQLNCP